METKRTPAVSGNCPLTSWILGLGSIRNFLIRVMGQVGVEMGFGLRWGVKEWIGDSG